MSLDYLEYIIGGFRYLSSTKFREKKQQKWNNLSSTYKIYEIGMWIAMPLIGGIVILITYLQ